MKKISLLLPAVASLLLLTGCEGFAIMGGAAAGGMYATKPSELPPADLTAQMPQHESWCYKTLGEEVECYPTPQATPPGRLVNVDPANRFPLTPEAYAKVVAESRAAEAPKEPAKAESIATPPVQTAAIAPPLQVTPQSTTAPKSATEKAKKHKKHKKVAKSTKCAEPAKPVAPPIAP